MLAYAVENGGYSMLRELLLAAALLAGAAIATAGTDLPPVSHDGLHLMPDTKVRAVYARLGADISTYNKIALLDCYVAFRKHWQRQHNDEVPFEQRVSDKDMKKIRDNLSKEFNEVFTEVLSSKGGHQMVAQGGDGVLILRPAIINLDVTAPDIMAPGMSRTFVASAGSMTLYLELYDGKTGDIIARIIDPEAAENAGIAAMSNGVTNRADADRILRRWATLLNDHLAKVSATGK
jgi:hypothetical protein